MDEQMKLKLKQKTLYIFAAFLVLYEFATYSANDMIMPGMIGVVKEFNAPLKYVALSLVFYILGNTLLTLFMGPLSERYGKRKVILTGNLVFVISSAFMLVVNNIHQFLLIRTIEGMGLAVIAVGYALIHENFDDETAVRLTSLMGMVTILAPLLGPMLGAIIVCHLDWRFVFILMVILSTTTLIALFCTIPEHKKQDNVALSTANIIKSYLLVLKNKNFLLGVVIISLAVLPSIAWIGLSPVMLLHKLKLSYTSYIIYQIIVISGFAVSSIVMQFISGRMKFARILHLSASLIVVAVILSVIAVFTQQIIRLDLISWGLFVYGFGIGMCNGLIIRVILSEKSYSANYAMSVMIFAQMTLMMVGLSIFNHIASHFNYSLDCFSAITVFIGIVNCILIMSFAYHHRHRAWE